MDLIYDVDGITAAAKTRVKRSKKPQDTTITIGTVDWLSREIGCSQRQARRYCRCGMVPGAYQVDRKGPWRIRKAEASAWIERIKTKIIMRQTKELYYRIAAAETPENVEYVHVLKPWEAYKRKYRGNAHLDEGYIEALPPNTIERLVTYLHECYHMRHHVDSDAWWGSRIEAEAKLGAIRTVEKYGVKIPSATLLKICFEITEQASEDGGHAIVDTVLEEIQQRMQQNHEAKIADRKNKKRQVDLAPLGAM
jgi:hypothetical protein